MLAVLERNGIKYQVNFNAPIDISIPLEEREDAVNCFYAPLFETKPVIAGDFIGSIEKGGLLNFLNIRINPHGNGTHTECVGHIAKEKYTINKSLQRFHFFAQLITIYPQKMENGDRVITKEQLEEVLDAKNLPEAIIIRTMPNSKDKLNRNYSGSNPPYIDYRAIEYLVNGGVKHLLIDLPSVDREEDGGQLLAHKAFWNYPDAPRTDCTISEMIFVENGIKDGQYLLNIQIASFEIDVSPSKPVLFQLELI